MSPPPRPPPATDAPGDSSSFTSRDLPCVDCVEEAPPNRQTGVSVRPAAFWLLAYLFAAVMLGTTLPTPLYMLYQAQWHFSASVVTLVFAAYAAGVLAALLLAGRSSDQVGRRPVLAAALGFSTLSTLVFISAPSLGWLFPGRVLSGLSAGLVTGTATAALTESGTNGRRSSRVATAANTGGLALGPLIAGLFAEYGPNPTVLVFELYLGILALAGVALLLVPETVVERRPLSLRFTGARDPEGRTPGVPGRRARRLRRLLPAWNIQRTGAKLPRSGPPRGEPCRRGGHRFHPLRHRHRDPAPPRPLRQPAGRPVWSGHFPRRPGPDRGRALGGLPGSIRGGHGRRRRGRG